MKSSLSLSRAFGCAFLLSPLAAAQGFPDPKTEQHALLARFVGEWDVSGKIHAGEMVIPIQARDSVRLGLGGLCVISKVEAPMGPDATFRGFGILGYDRYAERYVGAWVDTDSHHVAYSEGTWDEATQTLTSLGEVMQADGALARVRSTTTFEQDGTRRELSHHVAEDGSETLAMELVSKRRPDGKEGPFASSGTKAPLVAEPLAAFVGRWKLATRFGDTPEPEGESSPGTMVYTPLLDGRCLWGALALDAGGMNFDAHILLSFDPDEKTYTATGIDSMNGVLDVARGKASGEKTFHLDGETYDDAGKRTKWTEDFEWQSADSWRLLWTVFPAEPTGPKQYARIEATREKDSR